MVTTLSTSTDLKRLVMLLIEHIFSNYSMPEYMIMDQDSGFMSTFINDLFKKIVIQIKTVAQYNHQSLHSEHVIKSLATILTKHLTAYGQYWPTCLLFACKAETPFVVLNSMDSALLN